ncbi:MAG: tetratricopeptide repeat protein [Selenomonadaceae bacterium]|nr:tetratricopeptide repeat protein [Selenomonadaceae bacterium]
MRTIQQLPFAVLGAGAAFTILWGVADPMAAHAEVRTYTGVGTCALGDIGTPEQAKNLAREKALQNAKEQAGVYLTNYTKATNTHLAANEITTITNNIINLVGEVQYQQTPSEANGQPVIVYTATLQANVDTDGIQDWLSRDEKQRMTLIDQTEASQAEIQSSIEQLDRITAQYNQAGSEQEKEQLKKEYNKADNELVAAQKNREGLELRYKGDYDGAIRLYRESIALDPKYASPWNNMGCVYDDLGNYDKAIECCRKAIELDPKDASPWSNMGVAYDNLGNYDKAIECYRKAIELDPDNKKYQENLAAAKEEL